MREKGGILEVIVDKVDLDTDVSAIDPGLETGPYLKMTVSDTGHGIPPHVLDRIFDPYFTTKKMGEGTGLGLSVVHGIIKGCGGTITVSSELGKGTTFEVYIPQVEAREIKFELEKVEDLPGGHERILLIDDEKALAEMVRQMLERLGYDVRDKTSSLEALELFRVQPNLFDLVITDMTMPDMTGDALARELLRIRPDIPIILCTGFSDLITKERAEDIGIREFVMKPLISRDFARLVRKVLDQ